MCKNYVHTFADI